MKRSLLVFVAVTAVALAVAGYALADGDDGRLAPSAVGTRAAAGGPETIDQVAFWQARADADAQDTVSRTQLAGALLARALAEHKTIDAIAADTEIDRVLAVTPADTSALLVKAQARMFVHDFAGGAEYAQRVLDRDPTHKSAIAISGDAAYELGDLAAASVLYDTLAARIPGSPEVFARHARLAAARGATADAIALAERAAAAAVTEGFSPAQATYYDTLQAELLRGVGRYREAAEAFQRVLAVNSEDGPAIEGLGKVSAALGDLDESERWWRRSGDLIGSPDFHVLAALGDIAHARGDDDDARNYWHQSLDAVTSLSEEERIGFLRDESRFRAGRGLDRREALRLAEQDLVVRQDALAYDTLAWAQLAVGETEAALDSIERALADGIADAGVWYHAAEIYAASGDDERARDALETALEISPKFDLYEAAGARTLAERLG
ncbi:MAG: tetratricopeptide repeat protein [Actinomycetota bacterium]